MLLYRIQRQYGTDRVQRGIYLSKYGYARCQLSCSISSKTCINTLCQCLYIDKLCWMMSVHEMVKMIQENWHLLSPTLNGISLSEPCLYQTENVCTLNESVYGMYVHGTNQISASTKWMYVVWSAAGQEQLAGWKCQGGRWKSISDTSCWSWSCTECMYSVHTYICIHKHVCT